MKKTIITALLALVALAAKAAVLASFQWQATIGRAPDSIKQGLSDFDTIVQVAEKDYAAFKFKVTDANRKEYEAFKKSLVKDIKKQRRTWQDAVCAYVCPKAANHPILNDLFYAL